MLYVRIRYVCFCAQFDVKNQRIFLRRTKYDSLHPEDLFVGNRVNVFSRQLNLIDYGDQYTANKLASKKERYDCVVMLYGPLQLHGSQLYITMQIIPVFLGHNLLLPLFSNYLLHLGWLHRPNTPLHISFSPQDGKNNIEMSVMYTFCLCIMSIEG